MPNGKSIGRQIGYEEFDKCELHIPQVPRPGQLEIVQADVDPDIYAVAAVAGKVVVAEAFADFVNQMQGAEIFPDKLIEGRRSAHGVTFGRLLGSRKVSGDGKIRSRRALNVALKPFADPAKAVNELIGYQALDALDVPTYAPVGVFQSEHSDHAIGITVKKDELQSLDRMRWVVGRMVDSEQAYEDAERNNQHIIGISETMAYVHTNGIFLPDGQIKNWAVTPSDKIGAIDTEGFIRVEQGEKDSVDLAWNDINKLVKSLVINSMDDESEEKMFGVGMLANLSLRDVRAAVEDLIINPYIARLEKMSETADGKMNKQIDLLYSGLIERFFNEPSWPQHFIDANR